MSALITLVVVGLTNDIILFYKSDDKDSSHERAEVLNKCGD